MSKAIAIPENLSAGNFSPAQKPLTYRLQGDFQIAGFIFFSTARIMASQ